jgi:hypothetical protein
MQKMLNFLPLEMFISTTKIETYLVWIFLSSLDMKHWADKWKKGKNLRSAAKVRDMMTWNGFLSYIDPKR